MKNIILGISLLFVLSLNAHNLTNTQQSLRKWTVNSEHQTLLGSFCMAKNGDVYIEDTNHQLSHFPIKSLSAEDQKFVNHKISQIAAINQPQLNAEANSNLIWFYLKITAIALILLISGFYLLKTIDEQKKKYILPIVISGLGITLFSFAKKLNTTTDPLVVNEAFKPFIPSVATSWDNTYFYVESKGIPNHTMMVGISSNGWQQQVPIPQCYIGTNHWSIPLNPVIASTPTLIDNVHFTRGGIGIAANGVPIFNYHTNTGVDSYTDGQLDNFGGHCGRGDDYHYHIAPLHLYTSGQTTTNLPCAYSFDGFPVYGSVEPDGSPMVALDTNHGHYGSNGVYHYHGTMTAPYMIGSFVGVVTEDATYQLIPQASVKPVRTENWTPLKGALITSCTENNTKNGYNLSYSLNGVSVYGTNFSWNGTTYTFDYVTPTATTSKMYKGNAQCDVPLNNQSFITNSSISISPNPSKDVIHINLSNDIQSNSIKFISIYGIKGELLIRKEGYIPEIDIHQLAKGVYFVKIQTEGKEISKKIIVQ